MIVYTLTDQAMCAEAEHQWTLGIPRTALGFGELRTLAWLHYYYDPLLAVLLNVIDADIENPRLFEAIADGYHLDDAGIRGGCTQLTLIRELPAPHITLEQRIEFGIRCALAAYIEPCFVTWAHQWLAGENRTDRIAAEAARAQAYAAYTAACAADAYASTDADYSAYQATRAADHAARTGKQVNLVAIARQVIGVPS
jgi:molybdopterin biosynthesis enzyme